MNVGQNDSSRYDSGAVQSLAWFPSDPWTWGTSISCLSRSNMSVTMSNDLQTSLKDALHLKTGTEKTDSYYTLLSARSGDEEMESFGFDEQADRCCSGKDLIEITGGMRKEKLLCGKTRIFMDEIARNISVVQLRSMFHLPLKSAARELDVSVTTLKRLCRRYKIPRWPHRQLKGVDARIYMLEQQIRGHVKENRNEYFEKKISAEDQLQELYKMRAQIIIEHCPTDNYSVTNGNTPTYTSHSLIIGSNAPKIGKSPPFRMHARNQSSSSDDVIFGAARLRNSIEKREILIGRTNYQSVVPIYSSIYNTFPTVPEPEVQNECQYVCSEDINCAVEM